MARRAQINFTPGRTVYAVPNPYDNNVNTVRATAIESATVPGLYVFANLGTQEYTVFDQLGADWDVAADTAFGVIPGITDLQGATPGPAVFPTVGPSDSPELIPGGHVFVGTDWLGGISNMRPDNSGLLAMNNMVPADVAGNWEFDVAFGMNVGASAKLVGLRIIQSMPFAFNFEFWNGTEWQIFANRQAQNDLVRIEAALPESAVQDGWVWVRIVKSGAAVPVGDTGSNEYVVSFNQMAVFKAPAVGGSGNAVFPDPSLVAIGTVYGPNGDDFTGTAEDLGVIPANTDVRRDVAVGGGVGVYDPADQTKVELGYMYGANGVEFTGSGCAPASGGGDVPPVMDADGNLCVVRGDDYAETHGDIPNWSIPDSFPDVTNATAKFAASGDAGGIEVEGLAISQDDRNVKMPLTKEQTGRWQSSDAYRYDVQVTWDDGTVKTLTFGALTVMTTYTDHNG